MKTTILIFLVMWAAPELWGQTVPPVSFEYDKDGNMTARLVVVAKMKSAVADKDTAQVQQGKPEPANVEHDVLSVMLGEQKISIYPNPTSGNVTVGVTLLESKVKNFLRLYDVAGRVLLTKQIQSELTPLEIKGPAGIYLLDIHLGDNVSKWKIIKE